jgi:hypothetical protein
MNKRIWLVFGALLTLINLCNGQIIPKRISEFKDLTDTPSTYSGQAGKVPTVNTGETALEFSTYRQVLSASTSTDTVIYILTGARTTYYDLTISDNITAETVILSSGSPQDGDSLILRVLASGAGRTLTLLEGGDGTFAFGSSLVALDISQTEQNKIDYIGTTWNNTKKRWLVISYSKGY